MKEQDKEHSVSRKEFLRKAGSTALFATLGIGFYGCSSSTGADDEIDPPENTEAILIEGDKITINLEREEVAELRGEAGWLLIREANTLVVNVDGQSIRAFTSICTHSQCSDSWDFQSNLFVCTCHYSMFNTSGEVVEGPAESDLTEFNVSRSGNTVIITK